MTKGRKPTRRNPTVHCPHCGQRMLVRDGVRLGPKMADLFDMIDRIPGGIDVETLGWVLYSGVPKPIANQRIRSLVVKINEMLASTTTKIVIIDKHYEVHRDGRSKHDTRSSRNRRPGAVR